MKLKTKAISLVFLLAAGAAAFHLLDPGNTAREARDMRQVIFTVNWVPVHRGADVVMEIRANDNPDFQDKAKVSPWQEQRAYPLGTKLDLTALQLVDTGELTCTIQVVGGARGGPNPMIPRPNGTGFCAATVVL